MTPEQIAELRDELQSAAEAYAWNAEHSRKRAATDLACYAVDHLEDANKAERHASRYRRAAEAIVALTTPAAPAPLRTTEPLPDVEDWADGLVACAFLQGVRPKLRRPTSADDAVAQILRAERGAIDCPFCGGLFPPLTITPKATP